MLARINLSYCEINDEGWKYFVNKGDLFPNLKVIEIGNLKFIILGGNDITTVTQ